MGDLVRGAGYLGRGFALLRRRPGLFVLGMVPALIVFVVLGTAFVLLTLHVGDLVSWATPFADGWGAARTVVRFFLAVALLAGALVVAASLFVGLTLVVGDPFYERIWRATEEMLGGVVPDEGPGMLSAVRDGVQITLMGVVVSAGLFVVGFVPVVGAVAGSVLGLVVSGRFLAGELVARPLEARGLDREARAALLRRHERTVYGFGVITQGCFLVPLAAIVVMPAAVVGSTMLARDVLDASPRTR